MKPTYILSFMLALVLGLLLGRRTVESPSLPAEQEAKPSPVQGETSSSKDNCAEFENLKSHLQGITPDQIREYLRTQNAEEKLKKADQILAQIMQVLVADIGFRLQKEEVDQLGHAVVAVDSQPPPTKEELPPPEKKLKSVPSPRIRFAVRNAQSEEQAKRVLHSMGMDFSERLRESGALTREEVRNLNGHFDGVLNYLRGGSVRMSLDFDGRLIGKNVEGSALVLIYNESGKVNSQARSNGRLSSNFSGTENSVFVKVGGSYLELVYFPNLDLWMGSYLEMDRGLPQKAGDVVLRRQ